MSDYIVQPKNIGIYNVHKFMDGADIPDISYIVSFNGKPRCSCPSGVYRGYCKHLNYVRTYRRQVVLNKSEPMIAFCDDKL